MVKIYISQSCSSCRKVEKWLKDHNLEYKKVDIINGDLQESDIIELLTKTDLGFEDIISTRSNIYKEKGEELEEMKVRELVTFISENPTILRRPIIIDDRKMQVGFNSEDIDAFLPWELKKVAFESCNPRCCPDWATCDCHE